MGLLRTLFFIALFYYLIRFITKVIVPFFRAVTEINERQKETVKKSEGISSKPKSKPHLDGEYVDYKEIKE